MAHLSVPREDLGRRLTGCLMNRRSSERCSRSFPHQARRVLRRDELSGFTSTTVHGHRRETFFLWATTAQLDCPFLVVHGASQSWAMQTGLSSTPAHSNEGRCWIHATVECYTVTGDSEAFVNRDASILTICRLNF